MAVDDDQTPQTAPASPTPRGMWWAVLFVWVNVALLIAVNQWAPPTNQSPPPCEVGRGGAPVCEVPFTALWAWVLPVSVVLAVAVTAFAGFNHLYRRVTAPTDPASEPDEGDLP